MGWQEDFQADGQRKMAAALAPPSPAIGTWKTTVQASPDHGAGNRRYDRSIPANIRHNNPGATYPAGWMKKYGMNGVDTIGGGHLIANFPNAASGAAANFELMERQYAGKPLNEFIHKWSGGNSSGSYAAHVAKEVGISPNTVITKDMIRDPAFAPKLLKAQLGWESGRGSKNFGLNDEHLNAAHAMYRDGNGQPVSRGASFTPPQTINRDGIVTTIPGNPQTAPMPTAQPSQTFASNMPVYGQQPAALAPPSVQNASFNPGTTPPHQRPGTNPTQGREVLSMAGLSPEQKRDTLQGAYDRGNRDMVYAHDGNERVVARPGEARWSPQGTSDPSKAGPNFANTFMVDNGYGSAPRPMPDSNPLKGSRYDDGTFTGGLPSPPAGMQPPQMVASAVSPAGIAPPPAGVSPSPEIKATPPVQLAALNPPQLSQANAPGGVVTSDANVAKQVAAVPAGTQGATEVAAGLPAPMPKANLGGTPHVSAMPTQETNAPNNVGAGRTVQAPAPDSAPAPAGVKPPTQVAAASPPPVEATTQPNTTNPEPSQVQAYKPSTRAALGGPNTKPETEPVKPLQGLLSDIFGVGQTSGAPPKPGAAALNGPNKFPQWDMNPANPGVKWASGGFSGFGAG